MDRTPHHARFHAVTPAAWAEPSELDLARHAVRLAQYNAKVAARAADPAAPDPGEEPREPKAVVVPAQHEVIGEAPISGSVAVFDAGERTVAYASILAGEGDDETVLGVLPVDRSGTISLSIGALQHLHLVRKTGEVIASPDGYLDGADHPDAVIIAAGASAPDAA